MKRASKPHVFGFVLLVADAGKERSDGKAQQRHNTQVRLDEILGVSQARQGGLMQGHARVVAFVRALYAVLGIENQQERVGGEGGCLPLEGGASFTTKFSIHDHARPGRAWIDQMTKAEDRDDLGCGVSKGCASPRGVY